MKQNKKAVSLMISYVLLISISLAISIGVFSWLKLAANVEPAVDCKDGTSLIIESMECNPDLPTSNLKLFLKNNGRFNIDGVIVAVGDNPEESTPTYLIPDTFGGTLEGHYYFDEPLKPGQQATIGFLNLTYNKQTPDTDDTNDYLLENLAKIEFQPFIVSNNERVICQQAIKRQDVTSCSPHQEQSQEIDLIDIEGLVSWWKFDNDLTDSKGSNNGQVIGSPGWVTGIKGQALEFDGVEDYVKCGDPLTPSKFDIENTDEFTFSAWIKLDSYPEVDSYKMAVSMFRPYLSVHNFNDKNVFFSLINIDASFTSTGQTDLELDTWYHILLTTDSEGYVKAYLNGVLDGTSQVSSSELQVYYDYLLIGSYHVSSYPTYRFNGAIDEVMVFNRALNQEEINNIYNSLK